MAGSSKHLATEGRIQSLLKVYWYSNNDDFRFFLFLGENKINNNF